MFRRDRDGNPSTATTMRRCRAEGGTAYSFGAGRGVVATTRGACRESPDGPGRLPPDTGSRRIGAGRERQTSSALPGDRRRARRSTSTSNGSASAWSSGGGRRWRSSSWPACGCGWPVRPRPRPEPCRTAGGPSPAAGTGWCSRSTTWTRPWPGLRAAGVGFRNEPISGPGGSQVLVEDPAGNPVELFQPR